MNISKNECYIKGCRNFETRCMDCGRIVLSASFDIAEKWIHCFDALPENRQIVLVADVISDFVSIARFIDEKDEYHFVLMAIDRIEHDSIPEFWMPLPPLPTHE